jgi:hypothetical protein
MLHGKSTMVTGSTSGIGLGIARPHSPSKAPTYFDVVVIGSGQATPALAVRLASAGLRTALIESRGE